jgi:predicted RNase H-like HicB family nuclease
MPQNGYWIECVPVTNEDEELAKPSEEGQYRAMVAALPEVRACAPTPDQAIQKLRDKLKALKCNYHNEGRLLPEHDNPISPPRNRRSIKGWISVYVQLNENCKNS